MSHPVADSVTRTVRQCADLCHTCIYRPGNLMHLAPGRVRQMTAAAIAAEGHIVCHATLDTARPAICAGFARHSVGCLRSLALRAVRAGIASLVLTTPPDKENDRCTPDRALHLQRISREARRRRAADGPAAYLTTLTGRTSAALDELFSSTELSAALPAEDSAEWERWRQQLRASRLAFRGSRHGGVPVADRMSVSFGPLDESGEQRVNVRVLLLIGSEAVVALDEPDAQYDERYPAEEIAAAIGIRELRHLPGTKLTAAAAADGRLTGWKLR